MRKAMRTVSRRSFLATGGAGGLAALAMRHEVGAAQSTPEEDGNIMVVNAFCSAFVLPIDWENVAVSLSSDCKYRASQTIPLVEGPDAIVGLLESFTGNATAVEFEIVDGPKGPQAGNVSNPS